MAAEPAAAKVGDEPCVYCILVYFCIVIKRMVKEGKKWLQDVSCCYLMWMLQKNVREDDLSVNYTLAGFGHRGAL